METRPNVAAEPDPQHFAPAETASQNLDQRDQKAEAEQDNSAVDRRSHQAMRRRRHRLIAENLRIHIRFELAAFHRSRRDEIERTLKLRR